MEVSGHLHAPDSLPLRNSLRYPLSRRQGGPQRSGRFGEEKNILSLLGIEARCLGCLARGLVAVLSYHCPCSICVMQITGVCWEYLYCNTERRDRDKLYVVVTGLPLLCHKMEHCHIHFRSLFGASSCDKHPSGTHKVHCHIACILSLMDIPVDLLVLFVYFILAQNACYLTLILLTWRIG